MKQILYTESPFGTVGIAEDGRGICALFFLRGEKPEGYTEAETPLLRRAAPGAGRIFLRGAARV